MRRLIHLVMAAVLVALGLTACEQTTPDASHTVDGRPYTLHVQLGHTGLRPLIVMLTGLNQSVSVLQAASQANAFGDAHSISIAWPVDNGSWNIGNGQSWSPGQANDTQYLIDVVKDAANWTPVDLKRVYIFGMSDGGIEALHVMCTTNGVFTAAGSIAGPPFDKTCTRPIWRHLHGGVDGIIPLHGGVPEFPTYDWCNCSFPDSTQNVGGFTSVGIYPNANHTWPNLNDGSWNIDGMDDLWNHTSAFHF